ncbi:MAG: hypothetical protein COZ69_14025 [Deltaproteobacteria bacterium CG_4_8_14_3_um_filter_45_9]|nr:MAG: hypothetical protein COS40_06360 [Deltaproteobacteria bacterium CG03_land_8_20_14_0_80_45_14]PIX21576.1 MAG: hypothetical protein COZ69_14025 [Deltaproteobacteria bacterium CG_4_8_14_3_um_filter_45_9]
MITADQLAYIEEHAYIPEHITHYVTAVSKAEPFLFGEFLAYAKKDYLIFVGYPLRETFEEKRMKKALDEVTKRFKPGEIALTAPIIPSFLRERVQRSSDYYYRLNLSALSVSQKLRNMLSRAGRELSVKKSRDFAKEHQKLIEAFLKTHPVDEATRFIFERIGDYLSSSTTAWVFEARNRKGELVAFDVAELWPRDYILYMFNFNSRDRFVPGASDLLLSEIIRHAQGEHKKYINLGLGINSGVAFFKRKWGGAPFLPYNFWLYKPSRDEALETFLQKL